LFATLCVVAAIATIATLWWARRRRGDLPALAASLALAAWMGLSHTGVLVNSYTKRWHMPRSEVLAVKQQIPVAGRLVSFGPVHHRFVYFYGELVRQLPWPRDMSQVPNGVEFFCFDQTAVDAMQRPADQAGSRSADSPGALPFAWTCVATIGCERHKKNPQNIVIGRIARSPQGTIAVGAER